MVDGGKNGVFLQSESRVLASDVFQGVAHQRPLRDRHPYPAYSGNFALHPEQFN